MTKYSGKDISTRLQRWILSPAEYKFNYTKGKNIKIAEFLSRIKEDEINDTDNDQGNISENRIRKLKFGGKRQ